MTPPRVRFLGCRLLTVLLLLPLAAVAAEPPSVLELAEVDQVPVPVLQPKPEVPANLALPRAPDPIEVTLVVDKDGIVRDPQAVQTSGHPELDAAAVAVLTRWRFRPGHKDGRPVATRMVVPVTFFNPAVVEAGPLRGPAIIPLDELDRVPMVRYQSRPDYPAELRRRGVGGEVIVEFVVDDRGMVRNPRAVEFPHTGLAEAAENAVGQWTFFPAMKGGRAVATRIQVPIEFAPAH